MKKILLSVLTLIATLSLFSQERMLMLSQYVHNQYLLNTAFAGSREALSLYGFYRQQWAGYKNPPNSQGFTIHAPLKNENVALGGLIYHESWDLYHGTKGTMSYTYRLITKSGNKIAFSLNAGLMAYRWGGIDIDYIQRPDNTLDDFNFESDSRFSMGFGTAWYGKNFFLGFSVYDFFYRSPYVPDASFFTLGKLSFIFTGGYLFDISESISLQPSMLVNLEPEGKIMADISASAIIRNTFWVGGTVRTNKEFIGLAGWNITPQLRVTYSYDFPTGELRKLSAGSHEISIQFDFGYKIITSSPKFF